MITSYKKQASKNETIAGNLNSRQREVGEPTGDADLQQSDKEEKKPWYKRTPIILALITTIGGLLVAFFQFVLPVILVSRPPAPYSFAGKVADQQTGKRIQGAKVRLEGKGVSPVIYTDAEGVFSFPLAPDIREIKIQVDAEGYNSLDRRIDIFAKTEQEDIRLTPRYITAQHIVNENKSVKPKPGNKKTSDREKQKKVVLEILRRPKP